MALIMRNREWIGCGTIARWCTEIPHYERHLSIQHTRNSVEQWDKTFGQRFDFCFCAIHHRYLSENSFSLVPRVSYRFDLRIMRLVQSSDRYHYAIDKSSRNFRVSLNLFSVWFLFKFFTLINFPSWFLISLLSPKVDLAMMKHYSCKFCACSLLFRLLMFQWISHEHQSTNHHSFLLLCNLFTLFEVWWWIRCNQLIFLLKFSHNHHWHFNSHAVGKKFGF